VSRLAVGPHLAPYPKGAVSLKRTVRKAGHSPPSSAGVKNGGAMPVLPHMSSWHNV
jgi:hypothetical protein